MNKIDYFEIQITSIDNTNKRNTLKAQVPNTNFKNDQHFMDSNKYILMSMYNMLVNKNNEEGQNENGKKET